MCLGAPGIMGVCANVSVHVRVRVVGWHVAARTRELETSDWEPGGQPCRQCCGRSWEPTGHVARGSPWEKNSLKTGTPLKSPQSPQVWLAYLVSSSSWNERRRQMPGPPGMPRMERTDEVWEPDIPKEGLGGSSEEAWAVGPPHTHHEAESPSRL